MSITFFYKIIRRIRHWVGRNILFGRFPYTYARYYYWNHLRKKLNYRNPKDINEKLFWLARYWQDPRIVQCADKLAVRDYVKSKGLEHILNEIYAVYETADDIDFSLLPEKFVIKTNHCGGGINMVICEDKSFLDYNAAKHVIARGLKQVVGIETCEYQYQYIQPKAYAEKYIGNSNNEKLEIQFFCFNGKAKHILVRNDLGVASSKPFAISYDMNWKRSNDRIHEDMSIDIPKPKRFEELVEIANKLASPFPHVRIDMYYVDDKIIFGEMTFSTSGNILWKYREETKKEWGKELVLPKKLNTKWKKIYKSQINK